MWVSEPWFPTGCYLGSTRLRSSLNSEKCLHLPVVFRFHLAPLHFEVRGRGFIFQTMDRTIGKATPSFCYSIIPPGRKAQLLLQSHCMLEHPAEIKAPHRGDVPPVSPCSHPTLFHRLAHKGSGRGLPGEPLLKLRYQVNGVDDPEMRERTQRCVTSCVILGIQCNYRGLDHLRPLRKSWNAGFALSSKINNWAGNE